jgi:glycosyltransferase involved in cell wall biosynthesis
MGKDKVSILHIDTEKEWRGGQQQVIYLFQGLLKKGITTSLVCQPSSGLADFCTANDLPFYPVRMSGELDILAAFKIAGITRRCKFDILHLHSAHAISLGLLTKLFYSSPKLIGVRRVDFNIRNHIFSRMKYKSCFLDRIVCISDGIKKVLAEDGIPPEKIAMIRSGIDINKFSQVPDDKSIRELYKIPENHTIIGTVAAMVGHKDYPTLLHAASQVIRKIPDITFLAVGCGPDVERIKKLHKKLQLDDRFLFAGSQEDVGPFLKSFDIFIMASKLEGLGTSILDAQALGLPIIATRTGGIPEIVEHNRSGVLVPPQDPTAMAVAIIELFEDESKRKTLGNNAKESVHNYSIEKTIEETLQLYRDLVDGQEGKLILR